MMNSRKESFHSIQKEGTKMKDWQKIEEYAEYMSETFGIKKGAARLLLELNGCDTTAVYDLLDTVRIDKMCGSTDYDDVFDWDRVF